MDIGAALPKSGSTTWADEVEAEEAEFGQGMIFYSTLFGPIGTPCEPVGVHGVV